MKNFLKQKFSHLSLFPLCVYICVFSHEQPQQFRWTDLWPWGRRGSRRGRGNRSKTLPAFRPIHPITRQTIITRIIIIIPHPSAIVILQHQRSSRRHWCIMHHLLIPRPSVPSSISPSYYPVYSTILCSLCNHFLFGNETTGSERKYSYTIILIRINIFVWFASFSFLLLQLSSDGIKNHENLVSHIVVHAGVGHHLCVTDETKRQKK